MSGHAAPLDGDADSRDHHGVEAPDGNLRRTESPPPPRRNIKLVIAYDGAAYHGWQRQAEGLDTVQLQVEMAAGRVMGHPVTVFGAGRTDAGVHADGQVANFYTTNFSIPLRNCRRAINAKLPRDIAIRSAVRVAEHFHASRSAVGKTYRYRAYVGPDRPVHLARQAYHYWRVLDTAAMRDAGRRLVGRHDFAGLSSAAEVRTHTVRSVWRCDVSEHEPEVHITVEGDGFLYNMVRKIAGTLIEIGRGLWSPDRIDRILATCDRRFAGPVAPAAGLTLVAVHY